VLELKKRNNSEGRGKDGSGVINYLSIAWRGEDDFTYIEGGKVPSENGKKRSAVGVTRSDKGDRTL